MMEAGVGVGVMVGVGIMVRVGVMVRVMVRVGFGVRHQPHCTAAMAGAHLGRSAQ